MSANKLRRILLVDDDLDIQLIAQVSLAELGGFEVEVCASGRQALDRAPDFRPELILLDAMLPELSGAETLRRLAALPATRETPIVFITGKSRPEEITELERLGALAVITKPFNPLELATTVRKLWERHHASYGGHRSEQAWSEQARGEQEQE